MLSTQSLIPGKVPGVFHSASDPVLISASEIDALLSATDSVPTKRARICTHPQDSSPVHEMIIAMRGDSYIRPHKHTLKSESFHVIQGTFDILIFDESGEIQTVIPMGPFGSGRNFYYRLNSPKFHGLVIHSEKIVFQETTNGPFCREETQFASWAPGDNDPSAHDYNLGLRARAAAWLSGVTDGGTI